MECAHRQQGRSWELAYDKLMQLGEAVCCGAAVVERGVLVAACSQRHNAQHAQPCTCAACSLAACCARRVLVELGPAAEAGASPQLRQVGCMRRCRAEPSVSVGSCMMRASHGHRMMPSCVRMHVLQDAAAGAAAAAGGAGRSHHGSRWCLGWRRRRRGSQRRRQAGVVIGRCSSSGCCSSRR